MVPAGGYGKCSSFVCTDSEHQSAVSLLLKLKKVLNLLHTKACLWIACASIFMLFLYWLSELQQLKYSYSFRAFLHISIYYCARTHATLQINLYGQVLTLHTLAIQLHISAFVKLAYWSHTVESGYQAHIVI